MTPLDPRYVSLQRELGWYRTASASLAVLIGSLAVLGARRWLWALLAWALATPLVALWAYRWPAIDYRFRGYRVNDEGIEIAAGVLWRSVITVPRSRVQHTDVSQGPLERKHGLGRLIIHTAGTQHARVELPGLAHEVALAIRDQLLPRQPGDVV
jgi:membrane protein YdbS with pleckstrin-like domain